MKLNLVVVNCLGLIAWLAQAGQPQPPVVIYGQIRDEYGQPMDSGAEVVVLSPYMGGGIGPMATVMPPREYGRYVLNGPIFVGVNYRITIPLEDAQPLRHPNAAMTGVPALVQVLINGVEQPLVPLGPLTIPGPGGVMKLDFSTAQDIDGDGLPDAWEELMVAWSGGLFKTIYDINPDDDFDGDGMSTKDECPAGTLPFLATDVFTITRSQPDAATGRMALSFTTVDRKKYHVLVSGSPAGGNWQQVATATTSDGPLAYQIFEGTGRKMTVYVDGSVPAAFFRIGVN